jgi:hypothetical protein
MDCTSSVSLQAVSSGSAIISINMNDFSFI